MATTTADAVVVLGDLFEVWVGDDLIGQSAFEDACVAVLRAATQRRPVYFMHGNRDFLADPDVVKKRVPIEPIPGLKPWTDDFSDILGPFRVKRRR